MDLMKMMKESALTYHKSQSKYESIVEWHQTKKLIPASPAQLRYEVWWFLQNPIMLQEFQYN